MKDKKRTKKKTQVGLNGRGLWLNGRGPTVGAQGIEKTRADARLV